jgi:hypothetical protein
MKKISETQRIMDACSKAIDNARKRWFESRLYGTRQHKKHLLKKLDY